MLDSERQAVLQQLADSEAELLALTAGLTPEQWHFRERDDRWSIADNLEHVTVLETFLLAAITRALQEAPAPEKRAGAATKEALAQGVGTSRDRPLPAREAALPTGRWPGADDLRLQFRAARSRTVAFAASTDADLRAHFFPHVTFGDLDCYQWLIVLGQHGSRHAGQIEQVMADQRFPEGGA